MRRIPVILIIFFYLACIPCFAMEALLVSIVSVDRVNGKMTVQVSGWSGSDNKDGSSEQITVLFSPEQLPASVKTGSTMRLWGNYLHGETREFQAQTIRGHHEHGNDPTGVRSRLGKRRHRGMNRGGGHLGGGNRGGHH